MAPRSTTTGSMVELDRFTAKPSRATWDTIGALLCLSLLLVLGALSVASDASQPPDVVAGLLDGRFIGP